MKYDVRASLEKKDVSMSIFANIYQNTTEDWNEVTLALSTGAPINSISPPRLSPWILDVYMPPPSPKQSAGKYKAREKKEMAKSVEESNALNDFDESPEPAAPMPESSISEKGPYFEITLPLKQTVQSSNKYQKKYIQEYEIKDQKSVKFYYELTPELSRSGFQKLRIYNTTNLPWLNGDAQVFLENEFMGNASIPFTPKGKEQELTLGIETRIIAGKELVKKFEDTSGLFGGNRRITYSYKITIENELPTHSEVSVLDMIPVSRNEKIKVEIQNLSLQYTKDEIFEKTYEYSQGIRKWVISLNSREKKEITYDVTISFDKEITIHGMK